MSAEDNISEGEDPMERENNVVQASEKKYSGALNYSQLKHCSSEPSLKCSIQPQCASVHSEPICKLPESQNITVSQKSCSDTEAPHNFLETESELSFGEIFHLQESAESKNHRDPVVVFWERSNRRENIENDIIVKFSLTGGEVFTQSFSKTSTVEEIKRVLAEMFKVPFNILKVDQNGNSLRDNLCINDIAIERFGSVTLQLSSLEPERYPLILNNVYPDIPTNDVLTVIVRKGGHVKEVIVEIENRAIPKPFLGGYRHKITKVEYHHAFTQTAPRLCRGNVVSRNTQTPGPCKLVETSKERSTQTYQILKEQRGMSILFGNPEHRQKNLELENKVFQEKVVLIQRNLRSWLVRKMMLKMKEEYKRCMEWERLQKNQVEDEKEESRQEREKALTKPESRGHFELLYCNLEEWRKQETERISNLGSIALRKSESFSILEMEIQYINSIERQRIQLKTEHSRKKQERLLEKTASPIRWKGRKGQVIALDSLGTQRARNFWRLYQNLQKVNVGPEERIQILEDVKKAVLAQENELVSELVSLIDREHHILLRDITHANIESLRDRINYMYLEYIKDPEVNPEVKKHLPENDCLKVEMYKCLSCQNVLPFYKFSLHTKTNTFRKCHNCSWLREIGGPRVDVNPIRHIMNAVRREELKESSYTSVALIMQEQDFYHLIINIWLGHSAIGGSGALEELRLGRWDFTQSWSPWNCILLTAAELKAHLRFSNPDQIYSLSFVKKIKQRHQMGRIYFSELAAYAVKRTSGNIRVKKMIQNFNAAKVIIDKSRSRLNHE
ncbi:hypothetical protein ONE63_001933 [Megalurothrips usitatus]|uniref:Ubiquitin-like domain-containing protein n=1 Tax=Megalurothrips usitatus TaxID=439358 RepID=A0AAV7XDX1_9NEOP|nr:hypothetical protein ONE63_001933 [Megalurothrips usitatus]